MEFRILGPLEVVEDGEPLSLGTAKQQALLAVLLLHVNEVVSRERLIDELWGERPPATADKAVQVYVSQLRKTLTRNGSVIATRGQGYVLELPSESLDAVRFERLAHEARERMAAGELEPAALLFRQALALWRGRALAGLAFEAVAGGEIERLEQERLSTLLDRIDCDLALGRHERVIGELEALVRKHPLQERLRGQLMLALYRSGRQADALAAYRHARETLVGQLGIEPSASLQRLERAILAQDPVLEAPTGTLRREGPPPSPQMGTVTFLFSDIEGSTRLLKRLRDRYGEVRAEHDRVLREAFSEHGGRVVDSSGDAFFVTFARVKNAVLAAVAVQRALAAHSWPEGERVRVRIGIHTGEASVEADRYLGLGIHRAQRVCSVAHGDQVLVSETTRNLLEDEEEELPGIELRDLGEHRLKDLARPVRLYQLVALGLEPEFPPPRVSEEPRAAPFGARADELAARAGVAARPRRGRRRVVAAAIAVAVAGAVLAAALIAARPEADEPAEAIALQPNGVAIIDPETNEVVGEIPLGTRTGPIAVGESSVWVGKRDDETVVRIDPATRKVERTIGLGAAPGAIAVGGGAVWVVSEPARAVFKLDPDFNDVAARIDIGETFVGAGKGLVFGAGSLWIRQGTDFTSRVDAATNDVERIPTGLICCVAFGERTIWAVAIGGVAGAGSILKFDPTTGARIDVIRFPETGLPQAASGLDVGAGFLWASKKLDQTVWKIDPVAGRLQSIIHLRHPPVDVAAGDDAVWTANADATLSRIDPKTERVQTIPLGPSPRVAFPVQIVVGEGAVWVTLQ